MKQLSESFSKNKLQYRLINRTDKVGLYELSLFNECVGYEVSRIVINKARVMSGVAIPEGEGLPSNESFGLTRDSDKAFFPHELERATNYFHEFSNRIGKLTVA